MTNERLRHDAGSSQRNLYGFLVYTVGTFHGETETWWVSGPIIADSWNMLEWSTSRQAFCLWSRGPSPLQWRTSGKGNMLRTSVKSHEKVHIAKTDFPGFDFPGKPTWTPSVGNLQQEEFCWILEKKSRSEHTSLYKFYERLKVVLFLSIPEEF